MIAAAAYDNWIGLALAVVTLAYLVAVLIFPERF
jgi:K+-transporting ATPase KdpF subunit